MKTIAKITSRLVAVVAAITLSFSPASYAAEAIDFGGGDIQSLSDLQRIAANLGLEVYLNNETYGTEGDASRELLINEIAEISEQIEIEEEKEKIGLHIGNRTSDEANLDDTLNPGWENRSDNAREVLQRVLLKKLAKNESKLAKKLLKKMKKDKKDKKDKLAKSIKDTIKQAEKEAKKAAKDKTKKDKDGGGGGGGGGGKKDK